MPLKRSECKSRAETGELPACHASLGVNALCEADTEARECKFERSHVEVRFNTDEEDARRVNQIKNDAECHLML